MVSYKPRYESGDHKAVCDVCGRLFKAGSLRKRWDGLQVCSDDWEPRHPQEFVRGKVDKQVPKWTRPEPQDVFVADALCGVLESSATPGLSEPGCMIPSKLVPSWYEDIPSPTFTL